MIAIPIIGKILIVIGILLFHHVSRKYIAGIFLALAAWILIPGIDELITFPLLLAMGISLTYIMIVYYGLGILLLLIGIYLWRF